MRSLLIIGATLLWHISLVWGAGASDTAKKEAQPYTERIPGSLAKFDMLPIPGGKYTPAAQSADEKPKELAVGAFYMSKTEVTWELFDIFAFGLDQNQQEKLADDAKPKETRARPSHPYDAPDRGFGHDGYPALHMSHKSATIFCKWLSDKTGHKYRLPTEIEWEYAARAKEGVLVDKDKLPKVAWLWENSDDKSHPVASLDPNAWGLYDMLGNVAEWCDGTDGKPCVRGGSWKTKTSKIAPRGYGFREVEQDSWRMKDQNIPKGTWWVSDGDFLGFRVVRDQ